MSRRRGVSMKHPNIKIAHRFSLPLRRIYQ
jgi:hypothetical protein